MDSMMVTLPADLATALAELASARGRTRAELVVEAVARFILEERQAIDRIVEARLRQLGDEGVGLEEERGSLAG
jgi:predicted transcriptional regulator